MCFLAQLPAAFASSTFSDESHPINLATEDRLSEAVLRRVLEHVGRGYSVGTAYGRTGFGYLRKTITGWNSAARGVPFVVLVDLDRLPCPRYLIESWLGTTQHPNLLVRIAVREVESWLLADAANLSSYLSISARWVPDDPDNLPDPKQALINLAARSRSADIQVALSQSKEAQRGKAGITIAFPLL